MATYPKGEYANTAKLSAILPRSEFIDPEHVANPCTRPQFAEGRCPKGSVIGTVKAYTPILEAPLTGKVYFRANGGARELPDIVLDLNGQVHFIAVLLCCDLLPLYVPEAREVPGAEYSRERARATIDESRHTSVREGRARHDRAGPPATTRRW